MTVSNSGFACPGLSRKSVGSLRARWYASVVTRRCSIQVVSSHSQMISKFSAGRLAPPTTCSFTCLNRTSFSATRLVRSSTSVLPGSVLEGGATHSDEARDAFQRVRTSPCAGVASSVAACYDLNWRRRPGRGAGKQRGMGYGGIPAGCAAVGCRLTVGSPRRRSALSPTMRNSTVGAIFRDDCPSGSSGCPSRPRQDSRKAQGRQRRRNPTDGPPRTLTEMRWPSMAEASLRPSTGRAGPHGRGPALRVRVTASGEVSRPRRAGPLLDQDRVCPLRPYRRGC